MIYTKDHGLICRSSARILLPKSGTIMTMQHKYESSTKWLNYEPKGNREWAHGATRGTDDNFVTTGPRDRARCIKIASTRLQVTCRCKTWHRSFGQNTIWCPYGMQCFCYTWQRQCVEMSVTRRCNARFWYKLQTQVCWVYHKSLHAYLKCALRVDIRRRRFRCRS